MNPVSQFKPLFLPETYTMQVRKQTPLASQALFYTFVHAFVRFCVIYNTQLSFLVLQKKKITRSAPCMAE